MPSAIAGLVVDIGNTLAKVGRSESGRVHMLTTFSSDQIDERLPQIVQAERPQYAILSSTRHLSDKVLEDLQSQCECHVVKSAMQLPFEIKYRTPDTLGSDRIAAIAGSLTHFPNESNLVIDAGTCITYDIIIDGKFYEGGNISPGLFMRLNAMHTFTDTLPLVKMNTEVPLFGISTETAILAGAIQGAAMEMEGMIHAFQQYFGELNVLLTGGDAVHFVNRLKTKIFATPNLVLQGLGNILQYHATIA